MTLRPSDQAVEALKPCPFCGLDPVFTPETDHIFARAHCPNMACPSSYGATLENWNRRAIDFPSAGDPSEERPPPWADEPPWKGWFSCEDCHGWFNAEPVCYDSGSEVCDSCAKKRDRSKRHPKEHDISAKDIAEAVICPKCSRPIVNYKDGWKYAREMDALRIKAEQAVEASAPSALRETP